MIFFKRQGLIVVNVKDDLEALDLELPAKNNNMYAQQTDMVKALYRNIQNLIIKKKNFTGLPTKDETVKKT